MKDYKQIRRNKYLVKKWSVLLDKTDNPPVSSIFLEAATGVHYLPPEDMSKIGVAVIACDRFDYTKQCVDALVETTGSLGIAEIIVVNDGKPIDDTHFDVEIINNTPPYQSVGVAKNTAITKLLKRGCLHIFIIENDIIVKDSGVFETYINASKATGIQHLNFGYHGPANRTPDYKSPNPRVIIDYPGGVKIALNPHSVGAFSYYSKKFIEEAGLHDLHFQNAWEHVELCQRAIKKGLLPAFWWFPDVAGSDEWLKEIPGSIQNSSITHTEKWTRNMQEGAEYYKSLYGTTPVGNPDTDFETVKKRLMDIYKKYKNE